MKIRCPAFVLAAATLVPALASQSAPARTLEETLLKPHADFAFEEQPDGSLVAADADGTYFFQGWADYLQSPFAATHGVHCATDRLPHPEARGTTSDCSSSHTNPAAEYHPQNGPQYVVPVVFHVIRNSSGTGQISDALLQTQITVLNEDFGAFGSGAPGTNTRIQFVLAGITRTTNTSWYNDSGSYYNSLAWDPTEYLNIYTNSASGYLGYAYVPSGGGVVGNLWDRVVVLWSSVGRPGPIGAPYNLGRTTTHEVGHYLGLYHTFDGGCASASNCYNNGDLICDTNPEQSPNYSPCTRTTCGSPDPTRNYMDYSDDACMNNFTLDQARRMRCTLDNFRVDLAGVSLPSPATNPSPSHAASGVSLNAVLGWSAGAGADSHDVYFGTLPSPGAGQFQGNQGGTSFNPGALAAGTTYYWRVDEVNTAGTTTGSVWSLTTLAPPAQASGPLPADGARHHYRNQPLTWSPGAGATSHDVYFGTTNPPGFVGSQPGTSFDTGGMIPLQTYYWRIDAVNAAGTTPGVVWSFTASRNVAPRKL